jgi:hypothetical protein
MPLLKELSRNRNFVTINISLPRSIIKEYQL